MGDSRASCAAEGLVGELAWRGLLHQHTGGHEFARHLETPGRVGYCGFDPTKDSLTVGNLVPIMLLRHWQRAGHKPIVLLGGGTGLIGDPSGKDSERQLLSRGQVEANAAAQRRILERLLDFSPQLPNAAVLVDNADWLESLTFVEVLRDIGKHFSVNAMIQKDSVRERLRNREQGISYTEFSYMLLQAYDFWHLYRTHSCTVQMAASDQYGNIVSGIDTIHRKVGRGPDGGDRAFALTAPLLTAADGKKMGKSGNNAIFLSAAHTSPYAFYQFWLNADDADVVGLLKWFTMLGKAEIEQIARQQQARPHERMAQRTLARELTTLVHGEDELRKAEAASQALFGADLRELSEQMLQDVFADVPHSSHEASLLQAGVRLVDLLPRTSLVRSKREARQFLDGGAIAINGTRAEPGHVLTSSDLLHAHTILLRRGKKHWHATRWT